MTSDFRCRPSYSSFFLVNLTTVTIRQFLCSFFEFNKLADKLILFKVEFFQLSCQYNIGKMKFTILIVIILLFFLGFLLVLVSQLFSIMLGILGLVSLELLLIHYCVFFYYNNPLFIFFAVCINKF